MGRPLNKKYFGNRNIGSTSTTADDGIGGQGVASVPNATGLTGMTAGGPFAILAGDISAPEIPGGVKPVLTFTATGATVGTIQVVSGGSGYTTAPTVIVRGALAGGSGTTTKTAVLSTDTGNVGSATNQENAILMTAQIGSTIGTVDVIRQVSTRRYKVKNAGGTDIVALKNSAISAPGEANLVATDEFGATYYVTKLTGHRATLTQKTAGIGSPGAGVWIFITGSAAPWTLTGPSSGYVKIDNA